MPPTKSDTLANLTRTLRAYNIKRRLESSASPIRGGVAALPASAGVPSCAAPNSIAQSPILARQEQVNAAAHACAILRLRPYQEPEPEAVPEATVVPAAEPPSRPARKGRIAARSKLLKPSTYRPDVPARDRLAQWTSPFGKRSLFGNNTALSLGARKARIHALISSVEPKTIETYASGLLRFHEFCDSEDVGEEERVPATGFLLSAFVAHSLGCIAETTVDNWLAGLMLWHSIQGAEWCGDRALRSVKQAIGKHVPEKSVREERPPVQDRHLTALRDVLDISRPQDAAIWAVALWAYHGCCRLGEAIPQSRGLFNPTRHVTRAAAASFKPIARTNKVAFHLQIPWTKTAKRAGALIVVTETGDGLCPVAAIRNHLQVNSNAPPEAPFFAFVEGQESRVLDKMTFMRKCTPAWEAAGLPSAKGHSFRIGGCTRLLLLGVHPTMVAQQGRWSSAAFMRYMRDVKTLVPEAIARACREVSLQSIEQVLNMQAVALV